MSKCMILASLTAMTFLVPAAASAAPAFLNCELTNGSNGKMQMQVQLNEDAGTAAYSFSNGDSFSVQAIFAPDKVSFGSFVIDRTTLDVQRINNGHFDQSVFHLPLIDYGRCTIDQRKRAF